VIVFRQIVNDRIGGVSRAINFVQGLECDRARLASDFHAVL